MHDNIKQNFRISPIGIGSVICAKILSVDDLARGYVSTWMVYHHSSWRCLSLPIYNPSVDLFHLCSQKPLCVLGWSVSNLDDGFCHCIDVSTGCPVDDAFKLQDKNAEQAYHY